MKRTLHLRYVDGEENKGRSFLFHVFQERQRLLGLQPPYAGTRAAFLPVWARVKAFQASHKPHPNTNDPIILYEIRLVIYIKQEWTRKQDGMAKRCWIFLMQLLFAVCFCTLLKFSDPQFLHMEKGDINNAITALTPQTCVRIKWDKVFKLYTTVLGKGKKEARKKGEDKKELELLQNCLGEQTQFPL